MRKAVRADTTLERQILTGIIVSDKYLKRVAPLWDSALLNIPISRTVAEWVMEYYEQYKRAPGKLMREVYLEKSRALEESDRVWIERFLSDLNEEFKRLSLNEAYLFDRTMSFFKRQRLDRAVDRARALLDREKVAEAEEIIRQAGKGALDASADLGYDAFGKEAREYVFNKDSGRQALTFGIKEMDMLCGPLMSEWLVMFMGPMKRGKTLALSYLACRAMMQGLNAVVINLESGYEDILKRIWMVAGSLVSTGDGKMQEVEVPVFASKSDMDRSVKWVKVKRPSVNNIFEVENVQKNYMKHGGGRLIVRSFPAYNAGIVEIRRYLDSLEASVGFQPHAIFVDYLGAMKPPRGATGRDVYDINSKELKALSQERKAVVVSAHQGNRKALDALNMLVTDIPEDVRVLGNIDILMGLNQFDTEKEDGVMRISLLMHRFRNFSRMKQVALLQQLELGQFCLASKIVKTPVTHDEGLVRRKRGKQGAERGE